MNAQPSVSATSWFSLPAVVTCTPEVADGPIVIAFAVSAGFTALVVISAHCASAGHATQSAAAAIRATARTLGQSLRSFIARSFFAGPAGWSVVITARPAAAASRPASAPAALREPLVHRPPARRLPALHGAPLGLGVLRLPRALRPRAADRPLDGVAPAVVEMDGVGVGQGLRPGDVPAGAPLAVEPGPPERERRQRRGDEDQVDPIPRRHAASPRQSRWWKLPAWCTVDSATSRPVRFTSPLIVASPAA